MYKCKCGIRHSSTSHTFKSPHKIWQEFENDKIYSFDFLNILGLGLPSADMALGGSSGGFTSYGYTSTILFKVLNNRIFSDPFPNFELSNLINTEYPGRQDNHGHLYEEEASNEVPFEQLRPTTRPHSQPEPLLKYCQHSCQLGKIILARIFHE